MNRLLVSCALGAAVLAACQSGPPAPIVEFPMFAEPAGYFEPDNNSVALVFHYNKTSQEVIRMIEEEVNKRPDEWALDSDQQTVRIFLRKRPPVVALNVYKGKVKTDGSDLEPNTLEDWTTVTMVFAK